MVTPIWSKRHVNRCSLQPSGEHVSLNLEFINRVSQSTNELLQIMAIQQTTAARVGGDLRFLYKRLEVLTYHTHLQCDLSK